MAVHRHGEVTLEAPESWRDQSQILLVGPYSPAAKFEPRVVVSRHALLEPQSASAYGRDFAASLPQTLKEARILEEGELSLDGVEAYRLVAEFKLGEAPPLSRLQLFVTRGLDLFILTADTPAAAFDQLRPELEGIMRSFRVAGGG